MYSLSDYGAPRGLLRRRIRRFKRRRMMRIPLRRRLAMAKARLPQVMAQDPARGARLQARIARMEARLAAGHGRGRIQGYQQPRGGAIDPDWSQGGGLVAEMREGHVVGSQSQWAGMDLELAGLEMDLLALEDSVFYGYSALGATPGGAGAAAAGATVGTAAAAVGTGATITAATAGGGAATALVTAGIAASLVAAPVAAAAALIGGGAAYAKSWSVDVKNIRRLQAKIRRLKRDMNAKVRGAKSSGAKRRLKRRYGRRIARAQRRLRRIKKVLKRRIARAKKKGKDTKAKGLQARLRMTRSRKARKKARAKKAAKAAKKAAEEGTTPVSRSYLQRVAQQYQARGGPIDSDFSQGGDLMAEMRASPLGPEGDEDYMDEYALGEDGDESYGVLPLTQRHPWLPLAAGSLLLVWFLRK